MKKIVFSLLTLIMCVCASAQIVNIPDANFKAILLQADSSNQIAKDLNGVYFKIDANNDSQIQTSEALQVSYLSISTMTVTSIVGISSFTNLLDLEFAGSAGSKVSTVDVTALSKLKILNCSYSGVQTLNLTGLISLEQLDCSNNALAGLDVSSLTNLKILTCGSFFSVPLTSLDVSNLINLEQLNCSGYDNLTVLRCSKNKLTQLSLINLPSLTTLEITQNPLTALSVSLLTNLQNLNCAGNQLQTLDVSNLSKLQSLNCSNNKLTSLYIKNGVNETALDFSGNPGLTYVCADASQISGVQTLVNSYGYINCVVNSTCTGSADTVVIADANFKAILLASSTSNSIARDFSGFPLKIDANNDSEIQVSEALQVRDLDVTHDFSNSNNPFIASLDGILSFGNLNSLVCTNNNITSLNLSGLTSLITLDCSGNQLKSMNLSGLTNLESLNCGGTGNQFGTLDLSALTKLKFVTCAFNGLSSLKVSGLTNLQTLDCGFNNFTTLDLSSLTNLQTLSCTNTQLLSLDVGGLTKLNDLQCSNNSRLNDLHMSSNQLTTLSLTSLPILLILDCTLNHLTALDVSGIPSLQDLNVSGNQLQTLDLTKQTGLQSLICSNNQLTSILIKNGVNEGNLDLSGNPGLLHVCADPSQISSVQSLVTSYGYINCVVDSNCSSSSDIVSIPDANFKAKLLAADSTNQIAQDLNGNYFKIDANNDSQIQVSEALQVSDLDLNTSNIASLEGISSFTNLIKLNCYKNQLTLLDLSSLIKLQVFSCTSNQLKTLDFTGLTNLIELHCSNNQLTSLSVNGLPNLEILHSDYDFLTTLDVSGLSKLKELHCAYNQLTSLYIKNGMNEDLDISNNPNLQYICADESQFQTLQVLLNANGYKNCTVNSFCPYNPGAIYPLVVGKARFDSNNNGCDSNDVAFPNLSFLISHGQSSDTYIADAGGNFSIILSDKTDTVTPVLENPTYFNVSPSTMQFSFPNNGLQANQDYCITANGTHNDFEITLLPVGSAVPGFEVNYKIVFKNKGNQSRSGTVNLTFDDAILDFVSADTAVSNQIVNNLSWNITNLNPLESRVIYVTLQLNTPTQTPAVNGGDNLEFKAMINSSLTDETPNDNVFVLDQKVVNSFDPNNIICLEGEVIGAEKVGDYVNYIIRFENSGTTIARNISVTDLIDVNKFDIKSLMPTTGSHKFVTRITETNKVEFIFENVNLPFDKGNNDGYVAFKIKTKAGLVLGDTFSNAASIYFDYNAPVDTNTAITTIAALAKQDFMFSNYLSVYPNPVKDILNITKTESIDISSMSVYNVLGQVMIVIPNAENTSRIDVSHLASGIYFIKINSDRGFSNVRFVKK